MRVVSNASQEMPAYRLGAWIYRPECCHRCWDRRPIICHVPAPTLHLARRKLVEDVLNHDFFVEEILHLVKYLAPFDQEEWRISS